MIRPATKDDTEAFAALAATVAHDAIDAADTIAAAERANAEGVPDYAECVAFVACVRGAQARCRPEAGTGDFSMTWELHWGDFPTNTRAGNFAAIRAGARGGLRTMEKQWPPSTAGTPPAEFVRSTRVRGKRPAFVSLFQGVKRLETLFNDDAFETPSRESAEFLGAVKGRVMTAWPRHVVSAGEFRSTTRPRIGGDQ